MKILDRSNNLIAIVQKFEEIKQERNFLTDNNDEMQFASFNLSTNSTIKRHKHNLQKRIINTTSEGIVVLDGKIQVNLYETDSELLIKEIVLVGGDSILMLTGGHEIKILENTKFIEFKQGPYDEKSDKVYF